MPNVMGREFPYTPEGMAAAQQYRQALGMRDGGMMGFRPVGMQAGGVPDAGVASDGMAIFQGLVDVTRSGSTEAVRKYIEANRGALNDITSMLPPGQADFVRNTLNLFAPPPVPQRQVPSQVPTMKDFPGYEPETGDFYPPEQEENLTQIPGPQDLLMDPNLRSGEAIPQPGIDSLEELPNPPWMSDPRFKGYYNPDQLNPFFNPNEISVADGGYVGRGMRHGGLMSPRRR